MVCGVAWCLQDMFTVRSSGRLCEELMKSSLANSIMLVQAELPKPRKHNVPSSMNVLMSAQCSTPLVWLVAENFRKASLCMALKS